MEKKKLDNRKNSEGEKEEAPSYFDEYDWRPFFISHRCVNPLAYNCRLGKSGTDH